MYQELDVIGRIANEVELRYSTSNKAILRLAVIVNNGENNKTTFNFVCFDKTAETHSKYLSKGDLVRIKGTMQNKIEEHNDYKFYGYNLYANQILYLNTKKSKLSKTPGEEVIEQVVDNMVKQNNQNINSDIESDMQSEPFKDFGEEIQLSDDMLPF